MSARPADTATRGEWLALTGGGEARALDLSGDRVALEASRAFPPGAPLGLALPGLASPLRVKVRGSRRTGAGRYLVEGRLVSATREARERLAALSARPAGPAPGDAQVSAPASAAPAEPAAPDAPPDPDAPL
ncbi:MAG: hypothetical protein IT376_08480 [Polyangiaceae bacterium]|nr:hypothetical protein [Polyangiaceae bacterium]